MTDRVARRVEIEGRVQGVGYRDWLVDAAVMAGLDGWVRNRRDFTVEALLAGPADAVDQVIAACRLGPRVARVTQIRVAAADDPGPVGFERRPTG